MQFKAIIYFCNCKQQFCCNKLYFTHTHTYNYTNACAVVCIANEFEQLTPIINPDKPIDSFRLAAFRINLHWKLPILIFAIYLLSSFASAFHSRIPTLPLCFAPNRESAAATLKLTASPWVLNVSSNQQLFTTTNMPTHTYMHTHINIKYVWKIIVIAAHICRLLPPYIHTYI